MIQIKSKSFQLEIQPKLTVSCIGKQVHSRPGISFTGIHPVTLTTLPMHTKAYSVAILAK